MVVEGEYEVGEDMKTARGCGLRLSVSPCSPLAPGGIIDLCTAPSFWMLYRLIDYS